MRAIVLYACLISFVFFSIHLSAQKTIEKTPEKQRLQWYQDYLDLKEKSIFNDIPWQFIGPTNISGRMTDVEVVTPKGKHYTIYVAGASGGIWKTENEGITWKPVFEHGMSTSFGDLALDPQNQNTIWAGTGEANIFRSSNAGAGIYVSKDAGETWEHKGLVNTNTISRVLVHPQNSEVIFVAAGGNEWTHDEERGIYKSIDGGDSWEKILYVNEMTGAYDLVIHPENPDIIYATTWQRIRKKWNDPRTEADHTETSIYKTLNGGIDWVKINQGLPEPSYRGRIGIDLCKAHPETLYAFIDNYEKLEEEDDLNNSTDAYGRPSSGRIKGATVYRSDDGGENWHQVSEANKYMERMSGTYGWVFGQIRVDPVNPEKVYTMGLFLNVSVDGGKTYKTLNGMHMDHHGLFIDPLNTNYLVNVNDGGVAISYDGENFRTFYDNLPLVQFYNVGMDMAEPFHVYGSIQDHFSYRGVVDLSEGRSHIPAGEFESTPGGEGSLHHIDPNDVNKVYSAGFYGSITKTDMLSNERKDIMPPLPEGVDKLRGQWLAPFILSAHNPGILYHGTQFVHRSFNEGESWEKISPDLTYNDPDKKGDIPFQTIYTLSESPLKFGLLYAGTDDGRVWMSHSSGDSWTEIIKGLPYGKWVSHMEASRFVEGRVYMTQNGKREDDFAAYIWKSDDFGETWESIKANIPYGPCNVIREDLKNENILYVGTDYGVFVSMDAGENWEIMGGALPNTYVHDINIHPRDDMAVIATHGRGMWALDMKLMREVMAIEKSDSIASLLEISDCQLPYNMQYYEYSVEKLNANLYVKEAGEIEITILGSDDSIVYENKMETKKGLNTISWGLLNQDDKPVEEGSYHIQIQGKDFYQSRHFEVKPFSRWK